jgi:hypothetical protein
MENAIPFSTSLNTHTLFGVQARPKDEEVQVFCKEIVGNLMYAMTMTRRDITYSISMVARYSEKPKNFH